MNHIDIRFPRVLASRIIQPLHEVKELAIHHRIINNGFDTIFAFRDIVLRHGK
jgi:hypothetical protein